MSEVLLEPLLRKLRVRQVVRQIPANAKLLDIGCGRSAVLLNAIAPHIAHGVGVDFKVERMQTNNIETIPIKLIDSLPFPDNSFDVVTMLAVLEHLEHETPILREIHRVLKHSGKLILTVPSVWAQPVLEFLAYQLKIVDEAEIRDHKRYYDRQALQNIIVREAKFQDFHHQYFQFGMNNFCLATKRS
ncbi:class I SAM-dependent methyltransferase [Myxacorys almedinensis]|uniref:Methyltransferase domain-containing protein n=1 Tax=Myxacorys almedinensis A TaxID=2690445 RepID=A0A8J7Z8F0_9CYAN|nr:class I SAM-dependent methyltransferase [Myxacorys almedinensis]NDJ17370.1 methyltransferase domain-containing protein [Myxacorys almedinensis A]